MAGCSGFARMTPPIGYLCRRCRVPGHFIQHCPTNGNPNYENKATVLPTTAAFEEEIQGVPYARPLGNIPPELNCPVCKQVMKDAVFTTRCCFRSYCSECIREHRGTKSACACGSTTMLIDDLVPNTTLRETISCILASAAGTSSGRSASLGRVKDELSKAPAIDVKAARAEDMEVDHNAGKGMADNDEICSVFKKPNKDTYPSGDMEVEEKLVGGKQGKETKQEKKGKQSYADAADVCQRAENSSVNRTPYFTRGCATTIKGSKAWTADFRKKQMKTSTY